MDVDVFDTRYDLAKLVCARAREDEKVLFRRNGGTRGDAML